MAMNQMAAVEKRRPGNPGYSEEEKEEIVEHVITQLATGRPVSRILREDPFMPSPPAFYSWLFRDPLLADKVERAREFGASALLDEVLEIADTDNADAYVEHDKDGNARAKIDGEAIQRSKLRVYAREKLAAMIAPRKYGAKVDITSGGNELKPSQVSQNKIDAIISVGVERALEARRLKKPEGED
jgi:hypothetical protein